MRYEDLEDSYVQTSLGRIHFKRSRGPGEKIVFLHGFGASTRSYKKLVGQLPENVEAYLVDLLGHGDSDAPEMDYTVNRQVQIVSEFVRNAGVEDCYLFGHSYGGWIAALIAQGRFNGKGIILEDSVGLKEYFDDISRQFTPEKYREKVLNEVRFLNPNKRVVDSILNSSKSTVHYLTRESLGRISKSTMIVWGENDEDVDVKYARLFGDYIRGSELEILQGAGHVPHFTHPDKIKELLLKFIIR